LNHLESDQGLCRILRKGQTHGMNKHQRRVFLSRWRKGQQRIVPSPSATFRYLSEFHDDEQEDLREPGKAFIPAPNNHLRGFQKVNKDFLCFIQEQSPQNTATLDMDATLVETTKSEALYCYKGYKSCQPFNIWWAKQGLLLHTGFLDGNVPHVLIGWLVSVSLIIALSLDKNSLFVGRKIRESGLCVKFDAFVKSPFCTVFVIPAKAGIQVF